MRESSSSNVAWRQLRDAYGSAQEVGELLNQIAAGQTGSHESSGQTKENYVSIGVRVPEALRPGIRLYERGLADPEEDVREASAALIEAVAIDRPATGAVTRNRNDTEPG